MELKNRIILIMSMLLMMALVFMLTMCDFIPELSPSEDDPTIELPDEPFSPPPPPPVIPVPPVDGDTDQGGPDKSTRWDVTAERTDETHNSRYIYSGEGFYFIFTTGASVLEVWIHGITSDHQGVHLDFPTTVNGYPIVTFSHAGGVFQDSGIESVNFDRMHYLRSLQPHNFSDNNIREVKFTHNPLLTQLLDRAFSGNPIELVVLDNLSNLSINLGTFLDLTPIEGSRYLRLMNYDKWLPGNWTDKHIGQRFPGFAVERVPSVLERNIVEVWIQPTKKE